MKCSLDLFGGKVALARLEACDRGWRDEPGDVLELSAACACPVEDAHANVSTVDRDGWSSALDAVTQAVFGDFGEKQVADRFVEVARENRAAHRLGRVCDVGVREVVHPPGSEGPARSSRTLGCNFLL